MNYKNAHTNLNIGAMSNHPEILEKAIIKGLEDRARSLCNKGSLQDELFLEKKFSLINDTKKKDYGIPIREKSKIKNE